MFPLDLYARVHFPMRKSHARPRVQQAPGLPCALYFEEGQTKMQTSDAMRREIAKSYSVRSPDERSEIRDHPHTDPDIASLIRATRCEVVADPP